MPTRPILAGFSLLLALTGCASPTAESKHDAGDIERTKLRLANLLSRAIQFQTVNPPGDEKPLAVFFSGILASAGIETRVIDTPRGESQLGRAAVWGVVRGSGERRPLILLSHLDVVPADASAWEHDPFAGVREDDLVIGRGALDAKGMAIMHLLTLLELSRREVPLKRDVIFLSTPDEESGGLDGAGFLTREKRKLLDGAEFLLTEGGGILTRGNEPPLWRIGVVEKSPCWLRVVARGTPGHSSTPPLDAAVPRLIGALERVQRIETPIRVVPEVARMYRKLATLAPPEDAAGFADLAYGLAEDADFRNRFMTLRVQAALVTNTHTITVLQGSSRTNVLPAEASAHIDARLLPGERCERFIERVELAVADPGIQVEPLLSFGSRSSDDDTPLFAAIEAVAATATPPAHAVPIVTIGFTDAHYFRDLGITAYGFTPRAMRREDSDGVHGHNERADVASLANGVYTLIDILEQLDRLD
ncbi:MAG TPA: M20/M25/M40 family metallo-hydrolase [Myxococcota bacterium]|nr:M20/M25/M40 family metallo-hydrolase [Myxococcota bacterium]